METVVFRSDIARLVLQYLKDQHLKSVAKLFCKSSPYLSQELNAYKKGFYGYSFFPSLEEVICEYVKIIRAVNKYIGRLAETDKVKLQERSLSEKINEILKVDRDPNRQRVFEESGKATNSSAIDTSESFESYKESSSKKCTITKRKRRKSSSSEWSVSVRPTHKKRRVSQPFCFLNSRNKNFKKKFESSGSVGQEEEDTSIEDNTIPETDLSKLEKPKNESTPRNKLTKRIVAKALPEFTQAILDNKDFQKKLVDNINQVLHSNDQSNAKVAPEENTEGVTKVVADDPQQVITSNQLLDEMVRSILEATEKDPTFDAIIQEVVGTPNAGDNAADSIEPTSTLARGQSLTFNCSNVGSKPTSNLSSTVFTVAPPASSVPTGTGQASTVSTTSAQAIQPRTPLVLRHAVAASGNVEQFNNGHLVQPNNNSFSVFMDPSFSISKLIVMNPNDSSQKPTTQAEQSALSIGNTTCEQILNHLNSAPEATTQDDQVFFDVSTGQLSFPLYLINDGTLPFVNSNEAVIPTNVITTPVILPSNVPVTADTANVIGTKRTEATTSEKSLKPIQLTKKSIAPKPPNILAQPVEQSQSLEGATPSTSGITNTKISKSLSTPRKRASHVRTLSFSPINSSTAMTRSGATPLSTRRQMPCSRTRDIADVLEEDEAKLNASECNPLEKPIIRNVEILPQLAANCIAANESSNSCSSVPPLFAGEEGTNQTVIKTELSLLEKCSCISVQGVKSKTSSTSDSTPKRKQYRKSAVRRCKRQLSKSSNEENQEESMKTLPKNSNNEIPSQIVKGVTTEKKNENENENENPETNQVSKLKSRTETTITIEDWNKMRSGTNSDLDARLRAINAKRIDIAESITKRKARPKRVRATSKKLRKKDVSLVVAQEAAALALAVEPAESVEKLNDSAEKSFEEGIQKSVLSLELSKKNDSPKEPNVSPKIVDNQAMACKTKDPMLAPPKPIDTVSEAEKRTANIGYLLETPFKDNVMSTTGSNVPPTPGVFMPTLDTPMSKFKIQEDILESTSYLFGSLTKSELGTPLLNAITPGIRFTPLVAKDATTPRSVATTEYSSGGSYYRPDESEDLDRNIDKMLRDSSAQKQRSKQEQVGNMTPTHDIAGAINEIATDAEICVEIPVETLKVAPIVLKRVKSFTVEVGETVIGGTAVSTLPINPHYKLASGLPEICAEKEENCDPLSLSATSSSSSSSSSSSPSSSSSSSSSSSTESNETDSESRSKKSSTFKKKITKSAEASLSLENLSNISSTEDEDWQKLVDNAKPLDIFDTENSQLIGNDGEVRYPVRSWLTPRKETSPKSGASIKMTLKSAEKCVPSQNNATIMAQRNAELELKRQRMKEKLKQSEQTKITAKVKRPTAAIVTPKTIQGNRKKAATKQSPSSPTNNESDKDNQAHVNVLAALNLSAKKQTTTEVVQIVEKTKESPHIRDADDNATSNVFETTSISPVISTPIVTTTCATTAGLNKLLTAKASNAASVHRRACVQIDALPAMKSSSRASSKSKQIVRTPLGFKSSSGAAQNDSITPCKEPKVKSSPKAKVKLSTVAAAEKAEKKRISPRLKNADQPKKKVLTKTSKSPTKVTKRTTTANKRQQKAVLEKLKENKRLLTLMDSSSTSEKKQQSLAGPTRKTQHANAVKNFPQNKATKKTKASSSKSIKELKNEKLEIESTHTSAGPKLKQMTSKLQLSNDVAPINAAAAAAAVCDDEDDFLEDCVRVTITEKDTDRFFKFVHDDRTKKPTKLQHDPELISKQLNKFKMNVAFDENVSHTWRISDEFCLFSCVPNNNFITSIPPPIRNIPKKRKIRITSSSSLSSDEVDNTKTLPDAAKASENPMQSINQTGALDSTVSSKNDPSEQTIDANVSATELNPTDKLEIEDIESILSHIHGAE